MAVHLKAADAASAASAALAGVVGPQIVGPEAMLWVITAMGICSLGDVLAPAEPSRWKLAVRYLSSVAVTLGASYSAAAWVAINAPEWRGQLWAVQIVAVIVTGLLLHPLIAMAPRLLADLWGAVLDRVRGTANKGAGQ